MLFEDTFEVTAINPDGKKFDRVTRLTGRGQNYDMSLTLDYNSQIYRLPLAQHFLLSLASTLHLDGTPDVNEFNQSELPSLADSYEYVMHGKVFKVAAGPGGGGGGAGKSGMEVFVSFGGLLMSLKGEARNLQKLELDQRVYLLIRKTH